MNPRFLIPDLSIRAELNAMVSVPFERLSASPDWAKAGAVAFGLAQLAYRNLYAWAIFFMVICAVVDFICGVKVAKLDGIYTSVAAHRGMWTKCISFAIAGLVRIVEHILLLAGLWDSQGMLAVIALVGFGLADMRSILLHREALGGVPIPFISALIDRIECLFGAKFPPAPATPSDSPQRRRDDGEGWEG